MEKLFSIEILVKTILFYTDKITPVPDPGNIEIGIKLGNKFNLKIRRDMENDNVDKEDPEATARRVRIDDENATLIINTGKSVVFPGNLNEMIKLFRNNAYEIEVKEITKPSRDLGKCSLKPPEEVINYVMKSEKAGNMNEISSHSNIGTDASFSSNMQDTTKPNITDEAIRLMSKTDVKLGIIELYVRLTNFGPLVLTHFQIFDPATTNYQRVYYFKNNKCKDGFQIQKCGSQVEPQSLPMAPILGASELEGTQFKPLFITPFKEKASVMVSAFKMMREEPEEEEEEERPQQAAQDDAIFIREPRRDETLTPSKIRRMLCGNRFCPVAMKFRDLGLGPFAPIRPGLGAPTGREAPHVAYGMSQMYGNMDQYGPYGLLRKKPSKCACMVNSDELIKPTCGCLDKQSDLEMKPVCGFGTCPFGKKSVESAEPCCMKDSKASPFFIPGFVPPPKKTCKNDSNEKCACQGSSDELKCSCMADEVRNSHESCGHPGCGLAKDKGCDCQKTTERSRGGKDSSKETMGRDNERSQGGKINETSQSKRERSRGGKDSSKENIGKGKRERSRGGKDSSKENMGRIKERIQGKNHSEGKYRSKENLDNRIKNQGAKDSNNIYESSQGGKDTSKENMDKNRINIERNLVKKNINFAPSPGSKEKSKMDCGCKNEINITQGITSHNLVKQIKKIGDGKQVKGSIKRSMFNSKDKYEKLRLRAGMDEPSKKDRKVDKNKCTRQSIILKLKELNLSSEKNYKFECCHLRLRAGMEREKKRSKSRLKSGTEPKETKLKLATDFEKSAHKNLDKIVSSSHWKINKADYLENKTPRDKIDFGRDARLCAELEITLKDKYSKKILPKTDIEEPTKEDNDELGKQEEKSVQKGYFEGLLNKPLVFNTDLDDIVKENQEFYDKIRPYLDLKRKEEKVLDKGDSNGENWERVQSQSDLRLRAGMEDSKKNSIPERESKSRSRSLSRCTSRSKSKNRRSKTPNSDRCPNKYENSSVKLRGGMDEDCEPTCGGNKCYLQASDPTCDDTCPTSNSPQPTCCGGPSCPISQDDKTGIPATSIQKTFTFTQKKKKEEFEPFYIKPVPRVSFKKNPEMADYRCSMVPSDPTVGDCCNAKDPPECAGPTKEPMFSNQKVSQSYGYPAPSFSNHEMPSCLGGSGPCETQPSPPVYKTDPMGQTIPGCLGGKSPCIKNKQEDPCPACGQNTKLRPNYAYSVNTSDRDPCSRARTRPRNQPGLCGQVPEPRGYGCCMSGLTEKYKSTPTPAKSIKDYDSVPRGVGTICGYGQYHPPNTGNCGFMPEPVCDPDPCCLPPPPPPCPPPKFRIPACAIAHLEDRIRPGGDGYNVSTRTTIIENADPCMPCGSNRIPKSARSSLSPTYDFGHPYYPGQSPPKLNNACDVVCEPGDCMTAVGNSCFNDSDPCQVDKKAGYCGMETCSMFPELNQTCGGDTCPETHSGVPGICDGDEAPFFLRKEVTLETCGLPTCPYADITKLSEAFNELTAADTCKASDCPYNLGDTKMPQIDCSCTEKQKIPVEQPQEMIDSPEENKEPEKKPEGKRPSEEKRKSSIFFDETDLNDLGQRPRSSSKLQSQSMNNYYNDEGSNDGKGKGCNRKNCKKMKYKTCSDCGGYSVSGATCDNPHVPFDPNAVSQEPSVDEEEKKKRSRERKNRKSKQRSEKDEEKKEEKEKEAIAKKEKEKDKEKEKVKIKPPPKQRDTRFVYKAGQYYPGIRVGHRTCVSNSKNVPSHMGWLWTYPPQGRLKKRSGWKPGIIGKTMMERIKQHRIDLGIPNPPELKMLISKKKTTTGHYQSSSESEEEIEPKPTLIIKKKDGAYTITMNPLKDPKTLAERENPYMNCTPMQFVITKQKPVPPVSASSLECEDGSNSQSTTQGSSKSSGTHSTSETYEGCVCEGSDREVIEESSSSESELEIEFTPPAGLIFPELFKKKPNVIHIDTQYNEADLTDPDLPHIIIASKNKKKKVKLRV